MMSADTVSFANVPQRRRMPRRQIVAAVAVERRRGSRRRGKFGPDGLQRFVLADDWAMPTARAR